MFRAMLLILMTVSAISFGDPTPPASTSIDDNPFIQLYKLRIAQAELNHNRMQALSNLAEAKLDRGRRLISQHAISQEEYDILVSDSSVTRADVVLAAKKI